MYKDTLQAVFIQIDSFVTLLGHRVVSLRIYHFIIFALFMFSTLSAQEKMGYSSHEEALYTAKRIEAKFLDYSKKGIPVEVQFAHLEGKFIDEQFKHIIAYLYERNIPISGIVIAKDEFKKEQEKFLSFLDRKKDFDEELLLIQKNKKTTRNGFAGFKEKLQSRGNDFFGTPRGVSFWKFFKKNKKRIYLPSENNKAENKYRWLTVHTAFANIVASFTAVAAKSGNLKPLLSGVLSSDEFLLTASLTSMADWKLIMPIVFKTMWEIPFAYLSREFSDFKNQGHTINYSRFKLGEKINLIKNKLLYYSSTIAFSVAGNSLFMLALQQEQITAGDMGDAWSNAFISNFAKIPIAYQLDKLDQKSKVLRRQGHLYEAEKLERKVVKLRKIWTYTYTLIKNIHLTAGILKKIPGLDSFITAVYIGFNTLGAIGLIADIIRYIPSIKNNIVKSTKAIIYNQWDHCSNHFISTEYFIKITKQPDHK